METNSNPAAEKVAAEERFIAAAVAPLGENAEMQVMAGEELRDALERGRIEEGKAGLLSGRLEKAGGERQAVPWFYGVVGLISVAALAIGFRDLRRWETARYGLIGISDPIQSVARFIPFHSSLVMDPPELLGEFAPSRRELLFGEPGAELWEGYSRLHEQHPNDPALYAEHIKLMAGWNKLPADPLRTADEIDPDNGWFR